MLIYIKHIEKHLQAYDVVNAHLQTLLGGQTAQVYRIDAGQHGVGLQQTGTMNQSRHFKLYANWNNVLFLKSCI